MRAYARRYGEDEERWAVTGLVHDLDYERFPDLADTENGHPRSALRAVRRARLARRRSSTRSPGTPTFLGVPRETLMAKTLFAVDELSGFVAACALVRPTGIEGMTPKSVRKKLKQPSFAAGVNRDEVRAGAEELEVDLDEHIAFLIAAMGERADELGLGPARALRRRVKRRWKILLGALAALAALLAINTIVVGNQTKQAEVTIDGGRVLSLPGGDLQVLDQRPDRTGGRGAGAPIVLLHCYSCSLHWWDEMAPILARRHRVIRVDLLGHGGSQKPPSGYAISEQAGLVAGRARPSSGSRAPSSSATRWAASVAVAARRSAPRSSSTAWSTSAPARPRTRARTRSLPGSRTPRCSARRSGA